MCVHMPRCGSFACIPVVDCSDLSLPENDTLARIGTSCFQQLLENNVSKLSVARWERVVTAFVRLFKTTTPHQLFDETLRIEQEASTESSENTGKISFAFFNRSLNPEAAIPDSSSSTLLPAPLSPTTESSTTNGATSVPDRRRIFKQIIVKCVLQLLLIETTHELLQNQEVYATIPPEQLLRLMAELDHSYQFAREFNADRELRTGLWKVGERTSCSNKKKHRIVNPDHRLHETSTKFAETGVK